jgi:hypothetical protein
MTLGFNSSVQALDISENQIGIARKPDLKRSIFSRK